MQRISKFQILASHINSKTAKCSSSSQAKTGILMMNMGGPQSVAEVPLFLERLFSDPDIINLPLQRYTSKMVSYLRSSKVKEQYKKIGGGSPILHWTKIQGQGMVQLLDKISPTSAPHKYYVGFRYAEPLVEQSLEQMERDGVERGIIFAQYPQYSCCTMGSNLNEFYRFYHRRDFHTGIVWSCIDRWPTHPGLIQAFVENIQKELEKFPLNDRGKVVILFSAHSLPQKVIARGDPYAAEVAATVHAVMDALGHPNPFRLVWQSKVGPIPWLAPQTGRAIQEFIKRGQKNLLLVPVAFVNDHIETLYELDMEYMNTLAKEAGVKNIRRAESLNDNPTFINSLADIVKKHLADNQASSTQFFLCCPECTNPLCWKTKSFIKGQQELLLEKYGNSAHKASKTVGL